MNAKTMISGMPIRDTTETIRIPVEPLSREARASNRPVLELRILSAEESRRMRSLIREKRPHRICEEIDCPNLPECSDQGSTTFMIAGPVVWTRRCPCCAVGQDRPLPQHTGDPRHLADVVRSIGSEHLIVTAADWGNEPDSGASRFASCIAAVREAQPGIRVEILTPDFRGQVEQALDALGESLPDIFHHDLVTVPRLYPHARTGANYESSLNLIRKLGQRFPTVATKSGLMLGLGEELDEVRAVMRDLRSHGCRMLAIGQYQAPSDDHLAVERLVCPEEFEGLRAYGEHIGFEEIVTGSSARRSYRPDVQAGGIPSMTEPNGILILGGCADDDWLLSTVDSVNPVFRAPSSREYRRYRLMLDHKPIVSRFLSSPS